MDPKTMEPAAVENFREYIRIKTVHPEPDYEDAKKFLIKMADQLELEYKVIELVPKNPIVIMTWKGEDPSLPSLLLNSHIDVVPCYPESWKYDPFAAVMTENGDIYGRGTQDMKCVGIQYLEAIRVLKSQNFKPLRTVHLSFVPDEEVGGVKGMVPLITTPEFKSMNVGFALDEGIASPTDEYVVFYNERSRFVVELILNGNPGHASQFIENTAGNKLVKFLDKYQQYRLSEKQRLEASDLLLGEVTTANLTILKGGVLSNVVPATFEAVIDFRVTPSFSAQDFRTMIYNWAKEAEISDNEIFIRFLDDHAPSTPTDNTNPWWIGFRDTCDELKMKIRREIFPAATDSRYLRKASIPALGFSPMIHTPILLHDHNEFLNRNVFLQGIRVYTKLLKALANIAKF